MKTETTRKHKIQSVLISFTDGTAAIFSGKAVLWPDEQKILKDIKFTMPRDLPDDCSFGSIDLNTGEVAKE